MNGLLLSKLNEYNYLKEVDFMTNNKKTSILAIYEILKKYSDKDHCLKQKEIIALLNDKYGLSIDRRTLYSNMKYLTEFGYEISKYNEGNGGYYLKHRNLKSEEVFFLCNILYSSTGIPIDKSLELSKKLLNQLSIYEKEKFLRHNFRINNINNYSDDYFLNISKVIEAIESKNLISFITYRNVVDKNLSVRKISKTVLVCPLAISYYRERVFIITCDKNGSNLKNYLLANTKDLIVIDEKYSEDIIPENELEEYRNSISLKKDLKIKSRLKCDIILLDNLIEYFKTDFEIIDYDDNFVEVIIEATEKDIIELVLHFSDKIELVEPGNLRTRVKNILTGSLEKYL